MGFKLKKQIYCLQVFLAESLVEPGGLAAVKVIDKAELCKEEDKMFLVDKEIEIMSQLDHPHIVRLYEVYENEAEVYKRKVPKMPTL